MTVAGIIVLISNCCIKLHNNYWIVTVMCSVRFGSNEIYKHTAEIMICNDSTR